MKRGKKEGAVRYKYVFVEYRQEKELMRKVTRNKNLQMKHDVIAYSLIS